MTSYLLNVAIACFVFFFLTAWGDPRVLADRIPFLRLGSLYLMFAMLITFSLVEASAENGVLYALGITIIPTVLSLIVGIDRFNAHRAQFSKP